MDLSQLGSMFSGILGMGQKAPTIPEEATRAIMSKPTEEKPNPVVENPQRDEATLAMSVAKPEAPAQQAVETKPDEKQSLLMKAVEGLAKTFGSTMPDLLRNLLKQYPAITKEAIADAMQAIVKQQQAPAETAVVPT